MKANRKTLTGLGVLFLLIGVPLFVYDIFFQSILTPAISSIIFLLLGFSYLFNGLGAIIEQKQNEAGAMQKLRVANIGLAVMLILFSLIRIFTLLF